MSLLLHHREQALERTTSGTQRGFFYSSSKLYPVGMRIHRQTASKGLRLVIGVP